MSKEQPGQDPGLPKKPAHLLRNPNGFTLAELLIVIVIIGVLAVVSISSHPNYLPRAWNGKILDQIVPIQQQITAKALKAGHLANAGIGVEIPDSLKGAWNLEEAHITADGIILLKSARWSNIMVLLPERQNEQISWRCIGGPFRNTILACTK